MLQEIDAQLGDLRPDLIITPVGVGSLAQAVVTHYKTEGRQTSVLTVEPTTAACLWTSLQDGENTPIYTTSTIMTGLNCGTVSSIAWPVLSQGVNASVRVSDEEAHAACEYLNLREISAGPCGGAALAALRCLGPLDMDSLGVGATSVVVLLNTEAQRHYTIPRH